MTWEEAVLWLRAQPDQQELVRACYFDDPLVDAAERYYRSSEWLSVRELAGPHPGRALDLGAGRGIASYALARDGWHVAAVEPDPSAIVGAEAIRRLAAESRVQLDVHDSWGERLPFADASFDLAFGRAVMHHARDLRGFCREVARVLEPGGVFVAARDHVISRKQDLTAFLASHPLHAFYGGENAYLLQEYQDAIRAAGLILVRTLNPLASDINLFPDTRDELRRRTAARVRLPAALLPGALFSAAGALQRTPGRLYTFLARKPDA